MLLAKSLGTDKAWEEYEYLVDYYFTTEKTLKDDGGIIADVDLVMNKFFADLDPTQSILVKGMLTQIETSQKELKEIRPKGEYYDTVLQVSFLKTTTEVAKDINMSAKKLNEILHSLGLIYKQSKTWFLYKEYEHLVPEYCDYHINQYSQLLKWTEKGREFLLDFLKKNKI